MDERNAKTENAISVQTRRADGLAVRLRVHGAVAHAAGMHLVLSFFLHNGLPLLEHPLRRTQVRDN